MLFLNLGSFKPPWADYRPGGSSLRISSPRPGPVPMSPRSNERTAWGPHETQLVGGWAKDITGWFLFIIHQRYLVGGWLSHPSEKYELVNVSWDDDIPFPTGWENNPFMFQSTKQLKIEHILRFSPVIPADCFYFWGIVFNLYNIYIYI